MRKRERASEKERAGKNVKEGEREKKMKEGEREKKNFPIKDTRERRREKEKRRH